MGIFMREKEGWRISKTYATLGGKMELRRGLGLGTIYGGFDLRYGGG